MNEMNRPIRVAKIAFTCVIAFASVATAQQQEDLLEEIIITAQKREQTLLEVPQTVQLIGAEMIENTVIRDVSELMTFVPGASEGISTSVGTRRYQLRGIYSAGSPTVGFYIGDSPIDGNDRSPPGRVYDMQQVEVLRGPQSTLYGNGAMGGVIRYVPNRPDLSDVDLGVRVGYSSTDDGGDDGGYLDAMLSIPLIDDKLGVRFVVSGEELGGWADDLDGNTNVNDAELRDFRAIVLYQPNDRFDFELLVNRNSAKQNGGGTLMSGLFPDDNIQSSGPNDRIDNILDTYAATLNFDFGFADLSSTITYSELQNDSVLLLLVPMVTQVEATILVSIETWINETRLTSLGDGPVQWMIGTYYTDRESVEDLISVWTPEIPPFFVDQTTQTIDTRDSLSVFGEISVELFDGKLIPLIGVRRAEEDLDGSLAVAAGQPNGSSFDTTNFRFNLSWLPNDSTQVFFNVAEGFRSGVFNDQAVCNTHNLLLVEGMCVLVQPSDELISYEVGTKLSLLNSTLDLEVAYYYQDWERTPQRLAIGGLFNAYDVGDAEISGIDLAAFYTPAGLDGLEITLVANWNSAEFVNVESIVASTLVPPFTPESVGALEGESLPFVPEFSASLGLTYKREFGNGLNGMINVTHNHLSTQFGQFGGGGVEGGYRNLLRARFGVKGEKFGAYLFGRNLLGEDAQIYNQAPSGGLPTFTRDYPRQLGIELVYDLR